jgi:hypothetical protein
MHTAGPDCSVEAHAIAESLAPRVALLALSDTRSAGDRSADGRRKRQCRGAWGSLKVAGAPR